MTRQLAFLLNFYRKISAVLFSLNRGFRLKESGYVLIIAVIIVPVLLFGAKYVLDSQTLQDRQATGTEYMKDSSLEGKRLIKQCAQEAALAVAQKWNPALTYKQQLEAMLRIADEVYNKAPTYVDSTVIRAVHGLDVARESTSEGKTYEPLKITQSAETRLSPSLKQIARTEQSTDINRYFSDKGSSSGYHTNYVNDSFNILYNSLQRDYSIFTAEDNLLTDLCYKKETNNWFLIWAWPVVIGVSKGTRWSGQLVGSKKYTTRTNLSDNTVKIECEGDKIKVTTDDDVAYAVPAQCNVDIILTIPTNNAASNKNNYDKNTLTSGEPYQGNNVKPSTDAKNTLIYQIAQEYRTFLKKFFYTQGVNVGVIPYSGNVTLRNNRSGWVKAPDKFVSTYFLNGTYQSMITGSMMYGTSDNLTALGSYLSNSYGLLCRGKTTSLYGNTITIGDLLSTEDPSSYKFRRMVYNSCYAGANLLSMKCEKSSFHEMNPYFILEMNPDVKFIYEMLGAFYPYYDDRNVSNFIFIPVTWAYNLLQSWSATGANSAVNTSADSTNLGRLSTPSKTTSGRKKAVIVVVNKPDWFEPGELTYLGFDNDFSEILMIESDCIRGDIDYSDTTKYFADGTKYDGTVAGAKKIIKLTGNFTRNATTGYYECSSGTATLKFPQKYLVKVVVEGKVTWKSAGHQYTSSNTTDNRKLGQGIIAWDGTKFLTGTQSDGKVITSTDGQNWTATSVNPSTIRFMARPAYGEGIWVHIGQDCPSYISYDGINWTTQIASTWAAEAQAYGNGGFMHFGVRNEHRNIAYWLDPSNPTTLINKGNFKSIEENWHRALGFCNGKWCAMTWDGRFIVSYDNGANWAVESLSGASPGDVTGTTSEWYGIVYGFGRYWAICRGDNTGDNSRIVFSRDGKTWYKADAALGTICGITSWFRGLGFNGTRFVSVSDDGYFAYGDCDATINFTNITSTPDQCTLANTDYKITEKQEFFIEPEQISPNTDADGNYSITFNATNLRLISAEVTNRPYAKVTPTVTRGAGDVFTLNAKVPFVITTNRDGTFTYTNPDGVQMTQNTTGGYGYHQVTPETHRYVKGFNDDGTPYYTVTVPFSTSSSNYLYTSTIGIAKERSESKSGLNIDYDSADGTGSVGQYMTYQKTNVADSTGTATVDTANGKIYCPIGTVLHVKAVPTGTGSVTFSNPNDLGETDINGATIASGVTVTSGQPVAVSGKTTFTFPASCFAKKYVVDSETADSTYIFSNQKLKFNLQNTNLVSAVLRNQMLRTRGVRSWSGVVSRIDYTDPALTTQYDRATDNYAWSGNWAVLRRNGFFRYSINNPWLTNVAINVCGVLQSGAVATINYYSSDGDLITTDLEYWGHSTHTETYTGMVKLGTPFLYFNSTDETMGLKIYWLKVTNLNPCVMNMNNTGDTTTGLWVTDGNLINFEGQGDLDITVIPTTPGTIKFNCDNENNTTHELYKEYNFCIEPSQMTDNGDGTQYVSYTASDCTVTATYEYTNRMTIVLSKPNDIPSVNWAIYGHKKEMKWKVVSQSPADVDSSNIPKQSSKSIEYDGTTCYMAGKTGLYKSTDLGNTWTYTNYNASNNYPKLCYGAGLFLWINNKGAMHVWDADLSPSLVDMTVNNKLSNLYGGHNCWAGATYANGYFLSMMCGGQIYKSVNGYDWTYIGQEGSLIDDNSYTHNTGFDAGCVFINGKWYAATIQTSDALPIICSSDGENWTTAVIASSTVAPTLYAVKDGYNIVYITYGSNTYMFMSQSGKLVTGDGISANSNYVDHGYKLIDDLGSTALWGLSYANGRFLVKSVDGWVSSCTYHDGVMWVSPHTRYSREINATARFSGFVTSNDALSIDTTNFVVTSISGKYVEIVKKYEKAIEYKKIRRPERSAYIDYSTDPYTLYVAKGRSDNSFFNTSNNGWFYDNEKGFYVNSSNSGYHTQIYLDFPGDYSGLTYSDDVYEMVHLNADGWLTYDGKKAGQYYTSGLSRTHTPFKNFVSDIKEYGNWNDYNNSTPGSISLMMQTMTIPVNVALWAGASGETLYHYKWQSEPNETWGRVFSTYDATTAVKEVTKSACAKLKSDYGDNLRVYLIKYRKQSQYKHLVTQATMDFDYSYLNDCATGTEEPYTYDITTEAELNNALSAIYTNIKDWAGRTEARNVVN